MQQTSCLVTRLHRLEHSVNSVLTALQLLERERLEDIKRHFAQDLLDLWNYKHFLTHFEWSCLTLRLLLTWYLLRRHAVWGDQRRTLHLSWTHRLVRPFWCLVHSFIIKLLFYDCQNQNSEGPLSIDATHLTEEHKQHSNKQGQTDNKFRQGHNLIRPVLKYRRRSNKDIVQKI